MFRTRPRRLAAATFLLATLAAAATAQGTPIGFEETYALAADRQAAVATLIPGTDDWYYYHCRERLDARDFATVRAVLPTWIERHGRGQRVLEIENREALLSFGDNPERSWAFLQQRLGLTFAHQRVVPGARSELPTRLDPASIAPARLTAEALARHPDTVDGFTDEALPGLLATNLNDEQLRSLLARLRRPDVPNLPALIVRDLGTRTSSGFGSLPIHAELRAEHLEQCARLRPVLLQDAAFVDAMLVRMQPGIDDEWQRDPATRADQLARLWTFAQRLTPAFNSLKAHVLYHWLRHDLELGAPDQERFLSYIRLPRRSGHPAEQHLRRFDRQNEFVATDRRYPTGMPPIGDDEPLVRACLEHFFASEDGYQGYAEYLDQRWLRAVLAETKILLGDGDMERWYSLLDDPARLQQIDQRVEITFPPTQPRRYGADDAVRIVVDTKNVPTLLLKVFVIDAFRYHVEKQRPVDATIELDGVVANFEQTFTYGEAPRRRVRRSFDLPMLRAPGTYVVELVGNGTSSRAVIHKGNLRCVERTTAGGQLFRVYDENGSHLKDARIWFGGRDYEPDEGGEILLPFSTDPGRKNVVLHHGRRSTLANFAHRAESYALRLAAHVEREALVAGRKTQLLLRPRLRLDDRDVSLQLLRQPVLTIVATDLDGRSIPQEVRGLEFADDRELAHEITVPERLQSLQVTLTATLEDLGGNDVQLTSDTATFRVNGVDATPATSSAMLVRDRNGYALEVRGKNGEPRVGQGLTIHLAHRDYRSWISRQLQTDERGRITLGDLPGIATVTIEQAGVPGSFVLRPADCRLPRQLHGQVGQVLRVPYQGPAATVSRDAFSLLGREHDEFAHLAMTDGVLELRDLAVGDYRLLLHESGDEIAVRVIAAERDGPWLVGREQVLQASPSQPLHLDRIEVAAGELLVRLSNHTPGTRVHVTATRYQPAFDALANLASLRTPLPLLFATRPQPSSYEAGRSLGDEYRYVLERRFQTRFPGNMLQRPSLLLNPWAVSDRSRNEDVGRARDGGGRFRGPGDAMPASPRPNASPVGTEGTSGNDPGSFANLDYLAQGARQLSNLVPDANGIVRVALADLGDGHLVRVLAVDADQAVRDTLVRDEQPLPTRARQLRAALAAEQHFAEQKRIQFLQAGEQAVLGDAAATEVEIFDSLAGVHRVLSAISRDPDLTRFEFVLRWPQLTPAEQRARYSEHACHELHFFLYHKDPAFFAQVVAPFLANKVDKTFLDHWLLGDDLAGYLEPWAFAQLNLIEQILLAQRLGGDRQQAVARLVRDQLALRPVSQERLDVLFDLTLATKSLDNRLAPELGQTLLRFAAAEPDAAGRSPERAAGLPASETLGRDFVAPADDAKNEDASREVDKESAFDSNAWNSAVGLGGELERRGRARQLFRAVTPTKLLVEHNYWHRRLEQTTPDVVAPNRFWADYAQAPAGKPFASAAIVEASGSFLEMMMALSVLDLPFAPGEHVITADGDLRTLRAATPLLLVRKEIEPAELATDEPPLLLGENFYRLDDRYRFENGERRDVFVTDEFLVGIAYGCQVVVTNPTSQPRAAEVLLQIPAGAIPVQQGFWTRGKTVQLQAYGTATLDYAFYFPAAGNFAHYPAHATVKDRVVANAAPRTLNVVLTPSSIDTGSWEHVSQQGTAADVLGFLDSHNVHGLDVSRVAWRLRDRVFFGELLARLRGRHAYDDTLWSYGILHRDADVAREYLRHQDAFLQACGAWLASPLVTIDPVERRRFQLVELDPLVHARAHQLGSQRLIGNRDLAGQYGALLNVLGYRPRLDSADWLTVTYYLLLQNRVEEALQSFARVDVQQIPARIQYDYLSSYLCFFTGDVQQARRTAEGYADHPVEHWQRRFAQVLSQLDEAEGKAPPTDDVATPDALAASAPSLEIGGEGRTVQLTYKNVAQCEVRYYELDVEFAFSARPFAGQDGTSAAFVEPNLLEQKQLPATTAQLAFELPARFQQKNVLVEVRAQGLVRSRPFLANALDVRFLESYGQVAVSEPGSDKPLPRTYVKVFAHLPNGQVRFHKDGYTDLRGRFDYASRSDDPNAGADRYAVLVLSEDRGAVVRELVPPTR